MNSIGLVALLTTIALSTGAFASDLKECKIRQVPPLGMFNIYIENELVTPDGVYGMPTAFKEREKLISLGACQIEQNLPTCDIEVALNDDGMFGVSVADYKSTYLPYSIVGAKEFRDNLVANKICQLPDNKQLQKCEFKAEGAGFFDLYLGNKLTFMKHLTFVNSLEWKKQLADLLVCN
jgi:hypothetical protein